MSTRSGDAILETDSLEKSFDGFLAVDNVHLAVDRGEFRSIIGPNGAGKTTLFNLITGAVEPSAGTVRFEGEDITDLPPEARVRHGIGRSFQLTNIFGGLTVHENVRLAAQSAARDEVSFLESLLKPTDRYDGINETTADVLDRIGLADVAEEDAASLPHGDKRRLEIGVVLAAEPELVMLDEPTAGMSIEETRSTINLIQETLRDKTLLLIEHDIELVMELSDRITVLNRGRVIAEGDPAEIAENEAVQSAYLGGMAE